MAAIRYRAEGLVYVEVNRLVAVAADRILHVAFGSALDYRTTARAAVVHQIRTRVGIQTDLPVERQLHPCAQVRLPADEIAIVVVLALTAEREAGRAVVLARLGPAPVYVTVQPHVIDLRERRN